MPTPVGQPPFPDGPFWDKQASGTLWDLLQENGAPGQPGVAASVAAAVRSLHRQGAAHSSQPSPAPLVLSGTSTLISLLQSNPPSPPSDTYQTWGTPFSVSSPSSY